MSKASKSYTAKVMQLKSNVDELFVDYSEPPAMTLLYLRRKITAALGCIGEVEGSQGTSFIGTGQVELNAALKIIDEVIEGVSIAGPDNAGAIGRGTAYHGAIDSALKPKPPIGLKPIELHVKQRSEEVYSAIERYMKDGKEIPLAWINEYNELAK